ncbi:MAG: RlmE family RNA methyltransferase [Spirochaetes bacterium]|nr:RlmE family RNA methyltransferase [Spirochaetota bacterium]
MSGYEKPDYWSKKARSEGYPARSVYKLMEIDGKFRIFRPGVRVLDIGAAPGSWSLWTLRKLKGGGFLAAVDLSPLRMQPPFPNFFFVQGDLHSPDIRAALRGKGPYDIIMSDAAPATSGNRTLDTCRSEAIVEAVADYADELLSPGGAFIAKLFVGGGERELLDRLRSRFREARGFKPKTCRPESFETYLVGLGYRGA